MIADKITGTVLVIDDDPTILQLVGEALREDGHRVALAASLDSALGALGTARFDLVLADTLATVSPEFAFEGWSALARIRARAGAAAMIIFTAHREVQFADYRARGFQDLILKPFDLDELLAIIRRQIAAERGKWVDSPPLVSGLA